MAELALQISLFLLPESNKLVLWGTTYPALSDFQEVQCYILLHGKSGLFN